MRISHFLLIFFLISSFQALGANTFVVVGDHYEKVPFEKYLKENNLPYIKKLIRNTVYVETEERSRGFSRSQEIQVGTAFYLGRHYGRHLFMTNHHNIDSSNCSRAKIEFFTNQKLSKSKTARCEEVLLTMGSREGSDLTLFSVKNSDLKKFIGEGLEIDFTFSPVAKSPVIHAGFGNNQKSNRTRRHVDLFDMNITADQDCVIASRDSRTLRLNEISHNFATGCDIAKGDSGGAIMDRQTGLVVGLIWAISPDSGNRSTRELHEEIFGENSDYVWKHMSYAISLSRLSETLLPFLEK